MGNFQDDPERRGQGRVLGKRLECSGEWRKVNGETL